MELTLQFELYGCHAIFKRSFESRTIMSKRCHDYCDTIKKRKLTNSRKKIFITNEKESTPSSDAESALIAVKEIFPVEELGYRLPTVILVHQIYSFIKNRTLADKEINLLVEKDVIRLFKLGFKSSTMVTIFTEDFKNFVMDRICPCQAQTNKTEASEDNEQTTNLKSQPLLTIEKCFSGSKKLNNKESKKCHQSSVVARFIFEIMPKLQDVSVDKELLQTEYKLSEEDLRTMMNVGLLAVRSVGSYWLSFPSAGEFMKYFSKGRAALIRLIKKCKFSEILQPELEKRQLDKTAKFGLKYHIYDLIGADLVQCVETTSGTLLRICNSQK